MRAATIRVLVVLGLLAGSSLEVRAQPTPATPAIEGCPAVEPAPHQLIVGTVPVAPFIIKRDDGTWGGISMDLWKEVARQLSLDYEIRELAPKDLADPAAMAQLDAFVSMNITAEREAQLDLTHAFYSTGLAIAVAPKSNDGVSATLGAIFTAKFGKLVIALFVILFAVGVVMWLVERRRNESQFGGSASKGIGAGLWWSAVTMTTVGYGDKAPVTILGRVLGLIWMFAAIIIISSFTAAISAALTVNQLSTSVSGPGDLPKVTVGTVDPSGGARYLARRGIKFTGYKDAAAAVEALAAGTVDAVVYEAPILQYTIKQRGDGGLLVLDGTFDNHGYAFALSRCSPLRERVNAVMLHIVTTDDWTAILARYLGG